MKHGRRDDNHAEIGNFYRSIPGCEVHDTGDVGGGFPDYVIGFMGVIHLVEVKDGKKPPSKRKLTPDEKKFHARWRYFPVHVVNNVFEAGEAIGLDMGAEVPF